MEGASLNVQELSFLLSELQITKTIQNEIHYSTFIKKLFQRVVSLKVEIPKELFPQAGINVDLDADSSTLAGVSESGYDALFFRSLKFKNPPTEILFRKLQKRMLKTHREDIIKLFSITDENNDKELNFQEFSRVIKFWGESFREPELKLLFDELDFDKSGAISVFEFMNKIDPYFFEDKMHLGLSNDESITPAKFVYANVLFNKINRYFLFIFLRLNLYKIQFPKERLNALF